MIVIKQHIGLKSTIAVRMI